MVSGNRVIISILIVDITNLHSFYQSHGHDRIFRIDLDNELVHRRDEMLGLALNDIYLRSGRFKDILERADALAVLGDDGGSDNILQEVCALGKLCILTVDENRLIFKAHCGIDIVNTVQYGDEKALVHSAAYELYRPVIYIHRLEFLQKLRAVEPNLYLDLALYAVGIDYLPGFYELFFYPFFIPRIV